MKRCTNCGYEAATGAPQCPRCLHWGTLTRFQRLVDVPRVEAGGRISSGIAEIDELVGGGLVRGVVYRLSGDAGAGKSTLSLDVAVRIAQAADEGIGPTCLYVCGEEVPERIRERCEERLGAAVPDGLVVSQDGDVESLAADFPSSLRLVVVDSMSAWCSREVGGEAGSNGQMVHAAHGLNQLAAATGCTVIALSHVNADGEGAGAKAINHWVDVTLVMSAPGEEGTPGTLKVTKNRHGRAPRVLAYSHVERGLAFQWPEK